ncbi:Selenoprotein M [Apodemus speciosus]|uniref:Selenoprotein M n=1 Tax=Apodemus speciosus TaxID=105296 RepID=A0ABQ0ERV4_APOSI
MSILLSPPSLLLLLAALVAPATSATTYRPNWNRLRGLARGRVEDLWRMTVESPKGGHNLVMKHLPGADPELVLLSRNYQELERIPLSQMTRDEINALVQELGFYRKSSPEAQVPPRVPVGAR